MNEGIVKPLRQRHVEALVRELKASNISVGNPFGNIADADGRFYISDAVPISGEIVRAASKAEMLNGMKVDDLEPWQAAELAADIVRAVAESLEVPKASTSPSPPTPTGAENAPAS